MARGRQPARYTGRLGPGRLETTTLYMRGLAASRAASRRTERGAQGDRLQRRVRALGVAAELVLGRRPVDLHEPQHRVGLVAGQHR